MYTKLTPKALFFGGEKSRGQQQPQQTSHQNQLLLRLVLITKRGKDARRFFNSKFELKLIERERVGINCVHGNDIIVLVRRRCENNNVMRIIRIECEQCQ